jgi:hypothetical protein
LSYYLKLSVGVTCHPYLLEIEGLFTQGWRLGRTVGESVVGILEMDSSDWSNGIARYHTIDTRPDTEFKPKREWAFWRTLAFVVRQNNGCFSYLPTKKFALNMNGVFLFLHGGLL